MIHIVGKLVELNYDYRGASGFLVGNLELEVNGRPVGVTVRGTEGQRIVSLIGEAPVGTMVEVSAMPDFRVGTNASGEAVAYMDVVAYDALLLGNVGTQGASFRMQGFNGGTKTIQGSKGSFEVAVFKPLAFNREGFVPLANIDMSFVDDESRMNWTAHQGKFVFVRGNLSGNKVEGRGGKPPRIFPRFTLTALTTSEVPSWLEEYASDALGGDEVEDSELVPF